LPCHVEVDKELLPVIISFCSSVGVSAMHMCPRLAGHIKPPRPALLSQPKSNLGLQKKFCFEWIVGPGLGGAHFIGL
jgi:hypothetical protein